VLIAVVRAGSGQQERRPAEPRKPEERAVGMSGTNLVLTETMDMDQASVREEGLQEEGRRHPKLLVWDEDGSCHEGRTPGIGNTTMFVESTWMAPVGSEVTMSVVPREGDAVGQELVTGTVVWHCPLGDEFKNQAGFGVLLQRHRPQGLGPDITDGSKEAA